MPKYRVVADTEIVTRTTIFIVEAESESEAIDIAEARKDDLDVFDGESTLTESVFVLTDVEEADDAS